MTITETFDLVIVGAGASGLAAGIAACRARGAGRGVLLLERMPRAGKKLLATGNGRCNLGNRHALAHPYHQKEFATPALRQCGTEALEKFFDSLGLALHEDTEGRLYPRSNMAASVLDALRFGLQRAGATLRCNTTVTDIQKTRHGFLLNHTLQARQIIVATGGCAAPAHGSNGSGLDLLRSLGHPIVAPKPALVPLTAQSPVLPLLQGLRTRGTITLARHTAAGEILFTEDGLSGIAAMEVSRNATPGAIASLDLLPEFSPEALTAIIGRWQSECPEMGLAGLLPRRVGEAVCKAAHAPADVAATCKDFRFTITGTREFPFAQVTAGGADVAAFDPHTLESRLVPGLFACGEALDVDGGCGGFNLHWAWASALLLK